MADRKAVVLLSGGLDSTTILALAVAEGFMPYAMSFRYGQLHELELLAAKNVASSFGVIEHRVVEIDLRAFGGSALTGNGVIAKQRSSDEIGAGIPNTYVPARNTIFLSYALAWAEVLGASDIFIGVNAVDYSGYPDCRPEYLRSYQNMARLATKVGVEGQELKIHAPLIEWSKQKIIEKGLELGVNYGMTMTCYDPTPEGLSCGECDACSLRLKGFEANRIADPAPYVRARV